MAKVFGRRARQAQEPETPWQGRHELDSGRLISGDDRLPVARGQRRLRRLRIRRRLSRRAPGLAGGKEESGRDRRAAHRRAGALLRLGEGRRSQFQDFLLERPERSVALRMTAAMMKKEGKVVPASI